MTYAGMTLPSSFILFAYHLRHYYLYVDKNVRVAFQERLLEISLTIFFVITGNYLGQSIRLPSRFQIQIPPFS